MDVVLWVGGGVKGVGWVVDWVFFWPGGFGVELNCLKRGVFVLKSSRYRKNMQGGLNRWCIPIISSTVVYNRKLFEIFWS